MLDYGEIIVTSWKITWKQKALWLFGLVASLSQVVNLGNQIFRILVDGRVLPLETLSGLGEAVRFNVYGFIAGLVILTCGLMFVLIALSSIGQIGLIYGIARADVSGNERLTFVSLLTAVRAYFWRIFGLSLAVGFGFLAAFLVLYGMAMALPIGMLLLPGIDAEPAALTGLFLLCLLPLMCVFMIFSIVIGAVIMFVFIAIINDNLGIVAAFNRSAQIIRKNFWKIALMAVLISAIAGVFGFLLSIPVSMTNFTPFFALVNKDLGVPLVWLSILCLAAYAPLLLAINALINAYIQALWTLLYRRLLSGMVIAEGSAG